MYIRRKTNPPWIDLSVRDHGKCISMTSSNYTGWNGRKKSKLWTGEFPCLHKTVLPIIFLYLIFMPRNRLGANPVRIWGEKGCVYVCACVCVCVCADMYACRDSFVHLSVCIYTYIYINAYIGLSCSFVLPRLSFCLLIQKLRLVWN